MMYTEAYNYLDGRFDEVPTLLGLFNLGTIVELMRRAPSDKKLIATLTGYISRGADKEVARELARLDKALNR